MSRRILRVGGWTMRLTPPDGRGRSIAGSAPRAKGTKTMSLRERVEQELRNAKEWAADAEFRARLAKAEAGSELRKIWMETEQSMAKLEARLDDLGGEADEAAQRLMDRVKEGWAKLKAQRNN